MPQPDSAILSNKAEIAKLLLEAIPYFTCVRGGIKYPVMTKKDNEGV